MHEREKLLERYDDAAFALMMDECAENEGAAFLAEFQAAAQAGDLPELPEDIDRACRDTIKREYAGRERKVRFKQFRRAAAKVAVAVFAAIGILGTLVMSVEAWRIPIMNFLLEDHGIYSLFLPVETTYAPEDMDDPLEYILPEEYVKAYDDVYNDAGGYERFIGYLAGDDSVRISATIYMEGGEYNIDTEDAVVSTVKIKGQNCYFIEKDGCHMIWVDNESKYFFSFYASAFDKEQFMEMADVVVEWCNHFTYSNP